MIGQFPSKWSLLVVVCCISFTIADETPLELLDKALEPSLFAVKKCMVENHLWVKNPSPATDQLLFNDEKFNISLFCAERCFTEEIGILTENGFGEAFPKQRDHENERASKIYSIREECAMMDTLTPFEFYAKVEARGISRHLATADPNFPYFPLWSIQKEVQGMIANLGNNTTPKSIQTPAALFVKALTLSLITTKECMKQYHLWVDIPSSDSDDILTGFEMYNISSYCAVRCVGLKTGVLTENGVSGTLMKYIWDETPFNQYFKVQQFSDIQKIAKDMYNMGEDCLSPPPLEEFISEEESKKFNGKNIPAISIAPSTVQEPVQSAIIALGINDTMV